MCAQKIHPVASARGRYDLSIVALPTARPLKFEYFANGASRSVWKSTRVSGALEVARARRREIFDVYTGPDTADVRIAAAEELSTYLGNVHAAGGFAKYDASRRAPFVAMLERVGAFPIPKEMIAVVCAFWLRRPVEY